MATGSVKHCHSDRGFYFIKCDDGSPDVFCHATELKKAGYSELAVGQRLQWEMGISPKTGRPMAVRLELLPPIISEPLQPLVYDPDDHDDDDEHRRLVEQTFMREAYRGGE